MRGLPKIVAQTPIGKAVDVEVLRKGTKKTVQIAVGLLEEDEGSDEKTAKPEEKPQGESPVVAPVIGLKLAELTDDARKKYGLDQKINGVLVEDVDAGSAAAQKGIKAGDVIVEAGQDTVLKPDDVAKSVEKVKKSGRKAVLLRVEDGKGDLRFVAVPFEDEAKQP